MHRYVFTRAAVALLCFTVAASNVAHVISISMTNDHFRIWFDIGNLLGLLFKFDIKYSIWIIWKNILYPTLLFTLRLIIPSHFFDATTYNEEFINTWTALWSSSSLNLAAIWDKARMRRWVCGVDKDSHCTRLWINSAVCKNVSPDEGVCDGG